jgi:hypothetical protein
VLENMLAERRGMDLLEGQQAPAEDDTELPAPSIIRPFLHAHYQRVQVRFGLLLPNSSLT